MAQDLPPFSVCRLSDDWSNFSKWELMVDTYARSILGLSILHGFDPRSEFRSHEPAPALNGDIFIEEWEQIDARIYFVIITSISDTLLEAVMTREHTSADAARLIKDIHKNNVAETRLLLRKPTGE